MFQDSKTGTHTPPPTRRSFSAVLQGVRLSLLQDSASQPFHGADHAQIRSSGLSRGRVGIARGGGGNALTDLLG